MKNITVICIIISCLLPCNIYCNTTTNEKNYEKTMNVSLLWKYLKGENQTIAFIDTGITKEAYEIYKERLVSPFNIIDGNSNVEDTLGHGTQVISITCGDGKKRCSWHST